MKDNRFKLNFNKKITYSAKYWNYSLVDIEVNFLWKEG